MCEGVEALEVRKYVSQFVSGVQSGESEEQAEKRVTVQTREEVASLKRQVTDLSWKLSISRLAFAGLTVRFERTVGRLTRRVEALEAGRKRKVRQPRISSDSDSD